MWSTSNNLLNLLSIDECTGVKKMGLIKIKRRKKKEKLNTRHLYIIDGSRVVSILLSLLLFFLYSHHALFIIIFDNDDIVKEQVMVKGEQKRT